jgi:hypothetical protein
LIKPYIYTGLAKTLIKKVGRLILIKSVFMDKHIRNFLVTQAVTWLLEEIVKWMLAFFCAGDHKVNGG